MSVLGGVGLVWAGLPLPGLCFCFCCCFCLFFCCCCSFQALFLAALLELVLPVEAAGLLGVPGGLPEPTPVVVGWVLVPVGPGWAGALEALLGEEAGACPGLLGLVPGWLFLLGLPVDFPGPDAMGVG